jgi:hypothetical protein
LKAVQERTGEADRKVTAQPLVFLSQDGSVSRFNLRKFSELPYHLIREPVVFLLFLISVAKIPSQNYEINKTHYSLI